MGRPPAHTTDDFLDAAVRLFADGGARAVTMASVARAVGAPSGSIYHRFADRPALLSAVWLRTVRRFQDEWLRVVEASQGVDAVVAASAWTVDWCRANLPQALVLHAGARAFSPETWPAAALQEQAERDRLVAGVVRDLVAQTGRGTDELALALFDLPLAVVRRHLANGEPPPAGATDLVGRVTRMILTADAAAIG